MGQDGGAGSEFEKISRREILGRETDRKSIDQDIVRYDFATKVAQGG